MATAINPPVSAVNDLEEIWEWIESFDAVLEEGGPKLARRILDQIRERARHAGLERGESAQRGIEKHQAEDFARERARLGLVLQRLRQRQQIQNLVAAEISEAQKTLHAEIFARASLN